MPYNFDFSKIKQIKTIEINPFGWVNPLYIEYGIHRDADTYGGLISCFWRVKDTKHTFIIPMARLDFISSGNYKKHFEDALQNFRDDYVNWQEEAVETQWAKEYRQQYSRYIVI